MKNNYDLLNGLFANPKKNSMLVIEKKMEQPTTKRTFKILNAPWEDFIFLTTLKGLTQAELINSLIEQAVNDNKQEIDRCKQIINNNKIVKN